MCPNDLCKDCIICLHVHSQARLPTPVNFVQQKSEEHKHNWYDDSTSKASPLCMSTCVQQMCVIRLHVSVARKSTKGAEAQAILKKHTGPFWKTHTGPFCYIYKAVCKQTNPRLIYYISLGLVCLHTAREPALRDRRTIEDFSTEGPTTPRQVEHMWFRKSIGSIRSSILKAWWVLFNKSLYFLGVLKNILIIRNLPYTPTCHRRVRKNELEVKLHMPIHTTSNWHAWHVRTLPTSQEIGSLCYVKL